MIIEIVMCSIIVLRMFWKKNPDFGRKEIFRRKRLFIKTQIPYTGWRQPTRDSLGGILSEKVCIWLGISTGGVNRTSSFENDVGKAN